MGYTTKNLREYRMEQGLSMSEKLKDPKPQLYESLQRHYADRLQISLKRRKTKNEQVAKIYGRRIWRD